LNYFANFTIFLPLILTSHIESGRERHLWKRLSFYEQGKTMTEPMAEVINRYRNSKHYSDCRAFTDACKIANAYLNELDPSPITPELLRMEGWTNPQTTWWKNSNVSIYNTAWGWFFRDCKITTIGQVRTLLRVFGSLA